MVHFYSEPWFAYHLGKLQSLGISNEDCAKIAGLNTRFLSNPLPHRKIPHDIGNRIIKALYDAGHHTHHEVREIVDGFHKVDFHKAFLLNSFDIDSLVMKIKRILESDLSGNKYTVEKRHKMLYLYHSCEHAKNDFLTPQGHFSYLFKIIESAFSIKEKPLSAEVGVIQATLPGADDFAKLISPNIRTRTEQSYIAFPLRQLTSKNSHYNPMVERYLNSEYEKRYQYHKETKATIIEDIRRQLSMSMIDSPINLSIESIASNLEMSRSTLYRHLAEHEVTFSQLLEDERKEKALTFLKETKLSMGEISDRLGYANLSAFNRAFKRWFDTTPSLIRMI